METYLFDMNDTIVDSSIYEKMHWELIRALAGHTGKEEAELRKLMSEIREGAGTEKTDSFDLSKNLNATELYYKILEKYARHEFALKTKSIPEIFRKIKSKGKKIGIVSSSQPRTIEIFLGRFGLMEYVDFIEAGKKDTVLFWVTLAKKHNIFPETAIVIDDSSASLAIAKRAGYNVLNAENIKDLEI